MKSPGQIVNEILGIEVPDEVKEEIEIEGNISDGWDIEIIEEERRNATDKFIYDAF